MRHHNSTWHFFMLMLACTATGIPAPGAEAQVTTRVSVSSTGEEGTDFSYLPSIAADGRFVTFSSAAPNLVPEDTNGVRDVFVHDRDTGATTRVSLASDGGQGNGHSSGSAVSADGEFVAFFSNATNLVPDDTNRAGDVFVHDRKTGQTTRVSVSSTGMEGDGVSHTPAISDDGRFVAFESAATNLVSGDTNDLWDVFVHDRLTGETQRVSVSSSGGQSNGDSRFASISANGRDVSFTSNGSTLVAGDTNLATDVFVRDREKDTTTRVSVASDGSQADDNSAASAISGDGRFVAFSSNAGNLDPDDTTASEDVFIHDRVSGQTSLLSVSSTGEQADNWSFWPAISAAGRFVSFVSDATNLVPDDTNGRRDVFLVDRDTAETTRVSIASDGTQGDGNSGFFSGPSLSADGRFVAFESLASNLVPDDTNGVNDAFVRDRGPIILGDIDRDGVVGFSDLLIVLSSWGDCPPPPGPCPADLDRSGAVDFPDLLIVLSNWT